MPRWALVDESHVIAGRLLNALRRRDRSDRTGRQDDRWRALGVAVDRCESLSAALVTVIREAQDLPPAARDLAIEVADAATDAAALMRIAPAPFAVVRPDIVLDLLHLLRHDLSRHADRIADLTNAGVAVSVATNTEVAQLRRLVERVVAEVLESSHAEPR